MLTLDTSGLFAYVNRDDPYHHEISAVLDEEAGPLYVPAGILAEIAYLLESRGGIDLLIDFLHDLDNGAYTLDSGERDIPRILQLVERYRDLRLGFSDAAVIACAERHGGRVVTADHRHFPVVARGERTITPLLLGS